MAALAYVLTTLRAKFEEKEKGATAVEYGLLVALIAAAIIATVVLLGEQIGNAFESVTTALTGAGIEGED